MHWFFNSENRILTAGHCVRTQVECKNIHIVFDYFYKTIKDSNRFQSFAADQVFHCKKIIHTQFSKNRTVPDFAIIELDRPAENRPPLMVQQSDAIINSFPGNYLVFGHPSGLPLKSTFLQKTVEVGNDYILAEVDSFAGNSGSPLIDLNTGSVTGFLVAGEDDYILTENGCSVPNRCRIEKNCKKGEEFTAISAVLELKESEYNHGVYFDERSKLSWNFIYQTCHYEHAYQPVSEVDRKFCGYDEFGKFVAQLKSENNRCYFYIGSEIIRVANPDDGECL